MCSSRTRSLTSYNHFSYLSKQLFCFVCLFEKNVVFTGFYKIVRLLVDLLMRFFNVGHIPSAPAPYILWIFLLITYIMVCYSTYYAVWSCTVVP